MVAEKPVLYLDVDGVLLVWPPEEYETEEKRKDFRRAYHKGMPARGVKEFLAWAREHFEIRWLTLWCPSGTMNFERAMELASILDVPPSWLADFDNPRGVFVYKTDDYVVDRDSKANGINWDEVARGRPFIWIEDGITPEERSYLESRGLIDRYVHCEMDDAYTLLKAWDRIRELLGYPAGEGTEAANKGRSLVTRPYGGRR